MRAAFSSAALLAAVLMAAALHDVEAMDKVRGARGIFVDVKGMSGECNQGGSLADAAVARSTPCRA